MDDVGQISPQLMWGWERDGRCSFVVNGLELDVADLNACFFLGRGRVDAFQYPVDIFLLAVTITG